jgi:hypothetical protein
MSQSSPSRPELEAPQLLPGQTRIKPAGLTRLRPARARMASESSELPMKLEEQRAGSDRHIIADTMSAASLPIGPVWNG